MRAAKPLLVTVATTAAVTLLAYGLPREHAGTGVGLAFLAATWWLVLRGDEATIRHHGLSLGGLLEPVAIEPRRVGRDAARALAWALGLALLVLPPYSLGFALWWHPRQAFHLALPAALADETLGQLLVVALPEEAFYRGYLQTALDDAWGKPVRFLGAEVGWGLVAQSALFAAGHFATETRPDRLAVFFPALVFGWLRARTRGVGAGAFFHAACNLFSTTIARGYGLP